MAEEVIEPRHVAMLVQGSEVYGVGAVERLYAHGWREMTFICFETGYMHDWLREHGARVELVEGLAQFKTGGPSYSVLFRMPRALFQARRDAVQLDPILKAHGIRVLHVHWTPQQFIAGHLRKLGYRSVWHIHNSISSSRLLGIGMKLQHRLARWGADLLIPVSDFVARDWSSCGVPQRRVHNAAVQFFERPNELPEGGPLRCLVAGRLVAAKGQHVAVEAVIAAREAGSNVKLDMFGGPLDDNAYVDQLRGRINAAGMADAIQFRGFCDELRHVQRQYHLGLQCSEVRESCSMWVCETLVDGLPLLASASGGTPELVADGVTGYLYPPGSVQHLTDKLIELDRDRDKLARMRLAAFERGQHYFSLDRLLSETLDAYAMLAK